MSERQTKQHQNHSNRKVLSMNEMDFRNGVEELLKTCKLLLLSNWKSFELFHGDSVNKQRTYETIKNKVKKNNGVYVYEKGGKCLYIGKGKPLFSRIKSHYVESWKKAPGNRTDIWYRFFSSHQGKVKIFWMKIKNKEIRDIVERMLTHLLKPEFEPYREDYRKRRRKMLSLE